MEIIVILVVSVIFIIVLALLLKVNRRNITEIKKIGENDELKDIANKLPNNEEICADILKLLGNENVKIKTSDSGNDASVYVVATNTILISNVKESFARVQTVAHECVHSKQDKRLLWFNFILTNIYTIAFIIFTVLTLFKVINTPSIFAVILFAMAILSYVVRSFLENDAMIKARYLAKDYMDDIKISNKEEIDEIVNQYDKMNVYGIKATNFKLLFNTFIKILIFSIICFIR